MSNDIFLPLALKYFCPLNLSTMKKNLGSIDRVIRFLIAVAIITFYFTNQINGTIVIGILALSAIFFLTSFIGFCPLYFLLDLNSKGRQHIDSSMNIYE
jgi:hypothetical protein